MGLTLTSFAYYLTVKSEKLRQLMQKEEEEDRIRLKKETAANVSLNN
jgi:hypothetical protein